MTVNKINSPLTNNQTAAKINEIIDDYTTKDLSNLSTTGYTVLNDSKALETGTVGSDPEVYSNIYNYYTSTSNEGLDFDIVNGSIIGSPTISSGKILDVSTCDNSNFIEFDANSFITSNSWKITIPFPTSNWNSNGALLFIPGTANKYASLELKLRHNSSSFTGVDLKLSSSGSSYLYNSGTTFSGFTVPYSREASDVSLISVEFTGTEYVVKTSINETETTILTKTSSNKLYKAQTPALIVGIGVATTFGQYGAGYIDLNGLSVQSGSDTVISGNTDVLVISYIKSITGSKITDSSYRNAFTKMYIAKGYVPYYTIDTTSEDYTLPMGDIYGIIERTDESAVHLAGSEDITGVKTFLGEKRIRFQQTADTDKLGFTLLSTNSTEQGTLELRPDTINSKSILSLGCWSTSSSNENYVGFRMHYGTSISVPGNTYNIVAPLVRSALTDFSIGTGFTGSVFFLPLGFSDGTNMVYASETGKVDLSSIIPSKEYIKGSKALPTGEAGTDSDVYEYISQLYNGISHFDVTRYTVVGSPTISLTGIMTGSNKSNLVAVDNPSWLSWDEWELFLPFPSDITENTSFAATINPATHSMLSSQGPDGGNFFFRFEVISGSSSDLNLKICLSSNGSTWDITSQAIRFTKSAVQGGGFVIRFNETEGWYKIWTKLGNTETLLQTISSSTNLYASSEKLYIGGLSTNTSSSMPSLDISKVQASATVQGETEVAFSPVVTESSYPGTDTYQIGEDTVTVNYYRSRTGSKVALATESEDIQAVYDYLGYSPYFTIDESNSSYTLPAGDLYGRLNIIEEKIPQTDNLVMRNSGQGAGSSTIPVYIDDNGFATPISYSVAKSVPSDAVFTDTTYSAGTGLSLSGTTFNHSNSVTAGTAGTSSATSGASLDVPYVTYDAQGHITATGTHTHTITGFLTQSDVTSTYTSSGTAPVNGQAVNSAISTAISSVYKPAGSVAFTNLPTLSSSVLGNVYDLTDSFTTDSRFVEGSGNTYPAGTNVVVVDVSTTSTPDYKFDVLAGFVDLSGYQLASTAVTHTASTAAGSATQPVYVNSSGVATATTYELNKTVPSDAVFTDTLNTAGSTDTSSQIYLIGATEQAANPQTYSHDTVYVDTNGRLHASSPATSANDTSLATTYWVTGKGYAVDSNVVHTTGDETVEGNKWLKGDTILGQNTTTSRTDVTGNTFQVDTNYTSFTVGNSFVLKGHNQVRIENASTDTVAKSMSIGGDVRNIVFKTGDTVNATLGANDTKLTQNGNAVLDVTDITDKTSDLNDLINNSKVLQTGNLSDNEIIYEDVCDNAHSTFDKSKFVIVGSPVLNPDGVLSSSTNSDYTFSSVAYKDVKTITLTTKFNTGSLDKSADIALYNTSTTRLSVFVKYVSASGKYFPGMLVTDGTNQFTLRTTTTGLSVNTDYIEVASYDVTTKQLSIKLYDENYNLIDSAVNTSTYDISIANGTYQALFGKADNMATGFSQDLKFLQLKVNSYPVFSGNKTGIDILKPDNYTAIGSPNISADGIVSGLGNSAYINSSVTVPPPKRELRIRAKGVLSSVANTASDVQVLVSYRQGNRDRAIETEVGSTIQFKRFLASGTASDLEITVPTTKEGDIIEVEAIATSTSLTGIAWVNGEKYTNSVSGDFLYSEDIIDNIFIGHNSETGGDYYWTGSIDCNSIKLYSDGNLVYQPCLKIPYTETKSGNKVIDTTSQARAKDAYEQGFLQKYTVIDEVNQEFALPYGDIYGAIETSVKGHSEEVQALDVVSNSVVKGMDRDTFNSLNKDFHSTFDLGKFSIVGTPSITTDGVVSGFSSSDYLQITNISRTFTESTVIYLPDIFYSAGSSTQVILAASSTFKFQCHTGSDGKLNVWFGNGSSWTEQLNGTVALTEGVKNSAYIVITANLIQLYVNGSLSGTRTVSSFSFDIADIAYIGYRTYISSAVFLGSLDLKTFKVVLDGIPVFSGNKTGIDTIKADNYTVFGTPTISDDGLFYPGATDYISTDLDLSGSWTIFFQFCLNNVSSQNVNPLLIASGYNRIFVSSSAFITIYADENNAAAYYVNILPLGTIKVNTTYFLKLSFDGTSTYSAVLTNLETGEVISDAQTLAHKLFSGSHRWFMGSDGSRYIKGFMDLNELKIYKNTGLIYQPCLKIPYTDSKDGKKMVDSAYKSRVEDAYGQFGQANYTIIDEVNKAYYLPKGSNSGFYGKRVLRDSYRNGINYWELWSDRTLEQGGSCTANTAVTFTKPFSDTNYVVTVPYSDKTTTGFTPTQTGDWIAKGLGNL